MDYRGTFIWTTNHDAPLPIKFWSLGRKFCGNQVETIALQLGIYSRPTLSSHHCMTSELGLVMLIFSLVLVNWGGFATCLSLWGFGQSERVFALELRTSTLEVPETQFKHWMILWGINVGIMTFPSHHQHLLQIFICCRNRSSWEGESDSWIASWQCFCAMDSFHTTSGGPCQYHVWHWIDYCLIVWSMFLPYVLGTKWWCGLLLRLWELLDSCLKIHYQILHLLWNSYILS